MRNLNVKAAAAPAARLATKKIQMSVMLDKPMMVTPTATAGLKAPPEIFPTEKAPARTVKPIARP